MTKIMTIIIIIIMIIIKTNLPAWGVEIEFGARGG